MSQFVVVAAALLTAASYQPFTLTTDTNVWSVAVRDVSQDGKGDIFLLCCDEKSSPFNKYVAVYVADTDGGYTADPHFRLKLDPRVSTLFFAETDGNAPMELVAAHAEGATVYTFEQGKLAEATAPRFPSLLPSNSKQPVFLRDTAADLDGDGIDEWIVPIATGYQIRTPNDGLADISCDVVSEIRAGETVNITYRLPSCHPFSLPGEPNKALAFLSDEYADFAHGEQWSKTSRYKIPVSLDEKWEARASMEDIDGNGLPDLIVTQTRGTMNIETKTHVYLASAPFTYPDEPTAAFSARGAVAGASLIDVDGDEKKDVVFVSVPFGLRNIVNFFTRGKVSVRVEVHPFQNGMFTEKPSFEESFLLEAPEGREQIAYTLGDFNGDGRMDAAFGSGAEKLEIHTGAEDRLISAKPWATIDIPTFGVARPYNLNGNDAEDIIIYHPGGKNSKRVDVVVF